MFASPCSPASSLSPRPFGSGAFQMRQRINIREHFWRGNGPITKIVVAQQSAPRRLRHWSGRWGDSLPRLPHVDAPYGLGVPECGDELADEHAVLGHALGT